MGAKQSHLLSRNFGGDDDDLSDSENGQDIELDGPVLPTKQPPAARMIAMELVRIQILSTVK